VKQIFLPQTGANALNGLLRVGHTNRIFLLAHRKQSGFIDKIRQVSTSKSRCHRRQRLQIGILGQRDVLGVDVQNSQATRFKGRMIVICGVDLRLIHARCSKEMGSCYGVSSCGMTSAAG
jgi:hypothetical protein